MFLFAGIWAWIASVACAADSVVPGAPHLLPEEALFYVRWDDATQARVDFANSSLGKMLEDQRLQPLATNLLAVAADF